MSLILKVERVSINKESTEMYLMDNTGNYSETNKGGWGSPNPVRSNKALMVEAYLNPMSGEPSQLTMSPYDPATASTFTVNMDKDGYMEIFSIAVDKVDPTVEGEYGWTPENGLTKRVGSDLKPITVREIYMEGSVEVFSYKTVCLGKTIIYRNQMNLDVIDLRRKRVNDLGHYPQLTDLIDNFNYVKSLLEGANYLWCLGNYTQAQEIVEVFEEFTRNLSKNYELY